ncbi:MAG TPA: hypothetical protein ENN36_03290 [Candidatus Bathyarchaeota archaeon]|nr:hypothetical protein [Candidatus Bathyarchaeota archaeon]
MGQMNDDITLQNFEGQGELRCRHGTTWKCLFSIYRLLNGRLQVLIGFDSEKRAFSKLRKSLENCEPFSIEGESEDGVRISASKIHVTRSLISSEQFIGYAQDVSRHPTQNVASNPNTLNLELVNFRLYQRLLPVRVRLDKWDVEIYRIGRTNRSKMEEHGVAYRHPILSTGLQIRDIPNVDEAREASQIILELLSLAQRGYVFAAVEHVYDAEDKWLSSKFNEPPFSNLGWGRPLIPTESLDDFLVTAFPSIRREFYGLELAHTIDHYLQSLTLRSVWPMSLGIFTAMETLKSAFYTVYEHENLQFQYWIVPRQEYEESKELIDKLIGVLCSHFPRFCSLNKAERDSFKTQLKNLNRRSYKTQLRRMLEQIGVTYNKKELQPFINMRNALIHQGHLDDTKDSQQIYKAIGLFERLLLAILGYTGPCELFDANVWLENW